MEHFTKEDSMAKFEVRIVRTEIFEVDAGCADEAIDAAFQATWMKEEEDTDPRITEHTSVTDDHTVTNL